ncbi:SCO4226 family nickel-binding protein [Actinospica durhamensis]|uniref:SCO4226 family nickel-binding protein n=1 Tax=Actinospica durhamensis TaxID=1508375 RepID=A0A941EX17_9ACTN|nr:SCO4226 family nickel-binding protein [Actinospica durhamensis]MBR7838536.1 SCO4226 family nickel-binding protein [Actinospica durhamensis]
MTTFMDVHRGLAAMTEEQLEAAHQADLAIEAEEHVHFKQWWKDEESGAVYCISDAPSAEAVQRVHERAGHRADEVYRMAISL